MAQRVGIIGLGRIGLNAARAFLRNDFSVIGCDTDQNVLEQFALAGGMPVTSPAAVAIEVDTVIILVLNDEQVKVVIAGSNGILESAKRDITIICMSTISRETIVRMSEKCKEKNIGFVDCPFTGGPSRIESRSLTLIAAAPEYLLERVRPVLEILGSIVYVGNDAGLGQAVKHCNQLLVGVIHAATMEVIALSTKLGLDPSLVTSVISNGIAGSEYFRLLSQSVVKKTPSPGGLGQMCKDMSIVQRTLDEVKMNAQVALAAHSYFAEAARAGMEKEEGADLMKVVERMATKN